jgi:hypothetical protein
MTKVLFFATTILTTLAYARPDSLTTPPELRFAPAIRTIAVESSAYMFIFGANGATVDLDLIQLPSTTAHSLGVRVNYQEFRRGNFLDYRTAATPHAFITSGFIRASHSMSNARTDVVLGMSSGDPREAITTIQLTYGIEMRAIIVRPIGSIFFRLLGSPSGASMQFGLGVGYID